MSDARKAKINKYKGGGGGKGKKFQERKGRGSSTYILPVASARKGVPREERGRGAEPVFKANKVQFGGFKKKKVNSERFQPDVEVNQAWLSQLHSAPATCSVTQRTQASRRGAPWG